MCEGTTSQQTDELEAIGANHLGLRNTGRLAYSETQGV